MSYDGSTFNIETVVKPSGGMGLSLTLQVGVLYAFQSDISINNALGEALAVHMLFDGMSSAIVQAQDSNITVPGQIGWSAGLTISQGSDNGYPRVACSVNGETINGAAVWINFDGTSNVIAASTGSKTTILPPTNLSVMQSSSNFGIFTDYYNTITWIKRFS